MSYRTNSGPAFHASSGSTTGVYNAGRRVPPPRPTTMANSAQDYAHEPNLTIPVTRFSNPSTLSKSVQQNPYMVRVGVMIDEATEPGTTDEDAARHRQRITALLTGNNPPNMPAKSRPITAGDAVALALRQRLKSEDETAVKNTLILLDEIMRTVPYFYRHIANEKFFRRMWRFVVPDYKNNWMTIFRQKPSLVGMEGFESEITKRVLILIRAWAEELSVMFHGRFDPDAGFFIERYRNKRSRVPFPEVPKTSTPWVCRVPSSGGASRYPNLYSRSNAGAASSSTQVQRMMSLDEVENTVKLFGSIIEGATSSEDVKEDVCADLASRCMQIKENLAGLSVNWDKDDELVRTVQTSELLQRSLNRYNALLNGTAANNGSSRANDSIDALPPRSVGLDSDDDESYRDAFSDDDSMSHNVRKLSVRSDTSTAVTTTRRGFEGGRRSSGTDRYKSARPSDNDGTSRDVGRMRSVDERRLQSRDFERDSERERFHSRHHDDHRLRSRDDLELRREVDRNNDHDLRSRPRSRARDDEAIERRERYPERTPSSRDKRYGSQAERGDDSDRKDRKSRGSASAGISRREHDDDGALEKRERKSSVSKKASSSSSKRSKADGNSENGTGESSSKGGGSGGGPVINKKKNISSSHGSEKKLIKYDEDEIFDDDEKDDDQHQESFQMLAERFPAPKHRKGSKRSSKKKVTGYGGQQPVRGMDMVPGGMGQPMGMYPGGAAGMGVNPMMMPQGMPQPNPYAMYQTVNPVGMPDGGMGMYGAYSTVNPGMYYPSVNPGMMNTLNRMGSAGPTMHDSGAGPAAGALRMPMGMNLMNSVPAMHMGMGGGPAAMGQPAMTRSVSGVPPPPPPAGADQQQQEQTGTGQDDDQASGPDNKQVDMPLAPGDSDYNVAMGGLPAGPMGMGGMGMGMGMGMGGMGMGGMGMGGMGMDPQQNPAAMYQSAMHQAATAYHMAANAYRTMQGQAVIGGPTSSEVGGGGGGVEGGGGHGGDKNVGSRQGGQGES